MKTVGNGGNVQNSSGFDVVFATSSACTSLLPFEMESYGASTGTVAFWVQIPTLSHTTDTVIYLCYGDATVSTFQGGATGAVWDSNFKAVWHLPDGTTTSGADSTTNAVNTTLTGSSTASAGEIDGGVTFAGGGKWLTANNPYASSVFSSNGLTLEAWINESTTPSGSQVVSLEGAYVIDVFTSGATHYLGFEINGSGGDVDSTAPLTLGAWNFIVGTSDSSGNLKTYVNGVPSTTGSQTFYNLDSLTRSYGIGGHPADGGDITGSVDEARISNIARSADWILAEYNNESSPSTFYAVAGGASPATQVGGFMVGP